MWFRHLKLWFKHVQEWFPQSECDLYTHYDVETHKFDYDTHDCDFNIISTCTRVWFWHVWVWLRQARMWLTHAQVEFQLDTCDFKTNQLKWTSDHQKNPDWVLNSGYTTSTSVVFTLMRVLFTYECDFDTLRVEILYYNICINLSYRHMSAVGMLAESTFYADCNRTIMRVGTKKCL
jgi:hypothetical protein